MADKGPENMNMDPEEIARFNALAHRWWDPQGEFRTLHDINPVRLAWISERCRLDGARVLDVGCGGGLLSEHMACAGAEVVGLDAGEELLTVARLHALETGVQVNYRQQFVEGLAAEAPESFDATTCLEMLEHVPDPGSIVTACAALTKPGGDLFFATLNRNPKAWALAVVGAEYLLNLLPIGSHNYLRFLRPSELARLIREAGLVVGEIAGLTYNPFTHRGHISRNVDVQYLLHAKKPA